MNGYTCASGRVIRCHVSQNLQPPRWSVIQPPARYARSNGIEWEYLTIKLIHFVVTSACWSNNGIVGTCCLCLGVMCTFYSNHSFDFLRTVWIILFIPLFSFRLIKDCIIEALASDEMKLEDVQLSPSFQGECFGGCGVPIARHVFWYLPGVVLHVLVSRNALNLPCMPLSRDEGTQS